MAPLFLFPTAAEIPKELRLKSAQSGEIQDMPKASVLCTGMGRHVLKVLPLWKERIQGKLAILIGYAGALSPDLSPGDFVVCDLMAHSTLPPLRADKSAQTIFECLKEKGFRVHGGASHTSERVVCHHEGKKNLRKEGALVVEMENYWTAQAAKDLGLSLVPIRIILDGYEESLPDLTGALQPDGKLSPFLSMVHLLRHPTDLPAMLRLWPKTSWLTKEIGKCCAALMEF